MTARSIGSLCTGYGGLDMAVQQVYGGRTVWVSDVDKGANKILAHRYPGVPNLGDVTKTDWALVEPVDILTAGFPCQPVSHAGKRLGDNDERWLWDDVARAVGELRPGLVVLENVRGLLTAGSGRLFGRVLGTLAALGYDAHWHGLRAADIGAPHGRWRIFIVAHSASNTWRVAHRDGGAAADAGGFAQRQHRRESPVAEAWPNRGDEPRRTGSLLPTPSCSDSNGAGQHDGLDLRTTVSLLPTPTSSDAKASGTAGYGGNEFCTLTDSTVRQPDRWGDYAAAIARWGHALGRPAPEPTQTTSKGNPQLAAAFVEWMMGLPAGWVTDVPGITRNEALKALGNGVVPQQAAEALRVMAAWQVAA